MASPLTDLEKTLIFPTHPISPYRSADDPCDADVPWGGHDGMTRFSVSVKWKNPVVKIDPQKWSPAPVISRVSINVITPLIWGVNGSVAGWNPTPPGMYETL